MSFDRIAFPFMFQGIRPMVWVSLENAHSPRGQGMVLPALVDTGAVSSMAPRSVCEMLGHVFDSGIDPSMSGGIGSGRVATFRHASRLVVLKTPMDDDPPDPASPVFDPMDVSLRCVDQTLPFVLLGQSDFLNLFIYTQDQREGWFTLQRRVTPETVLEGVGHSSNAV